MRLYLTSLIRALEVKNNNAGGTVATKWSNPDILPMPPARRVWGYSDYLFFSMIGNLCITVWISASSLLSLGLSVNETIGIIAISRVLIVCLSLGNGWIGGRWHIGYTVAQRVTLGMCGAYIGTLIRIVLAIVWYASQAWMGGLCVAVMIGSWSRSFLAMGDTGSSTGSHARAHTMNRDFIGFVIFQIVSVPCLLIRPERVRGALIFSNAVSFTVMLGITVWACSKGGKGPLFHQGAMVASSSPPDLMSHSWAWIYGITSSVGGISSGILNQVDFTRFVRRQGMQVPGAVIAPFTSGIIAPVFGLLTASASVTIYGGKGEDLIWNPLTLILQWLKTDYSIQSRIAAFVCSLGFIVSQLSENVISNGYSAGMDLAGLFPRWLDIRRGSVVAALLSWFVRPWMFYDTSSVFMGVMSSFSVFLAPLTGIMMCDYFVVRKQLVDLDDLYTSSRDGVYWYLYGVNWRAVAAWVLGFLPALPGMTAVVSPSSNAAVSVGSLRYYWGNYILGFLEAGLLYYALVKLFPLSRVGSGTEGRVAYGTFSRSTVDSHGDGELESSRLLRAAS